jgi:hypothetical protein
MYGIHISRHKGGTPALISGMERALSGRDTRRSGLLQLILHAGTHKTGTTSLQLYLDRYRSELFRQGILYPKAGIAPAPEPKHQWLIGALLTGDRSCFDAHMGQAFAEADGSTTAIVLSTEGLFHRWWDVPAAGREMLAEIAACHRVEVWVVFREPLSYARSLYVQMLKNPRGAGPCYGEDISLSDLLDRPWFARQFDYVGYIRDVETLLGAGVVHPFPYGETTSTVLKALGVAPPGPSLRQNRSLGDFGVELMRILNRRTLDEERRSRALSLIGQVDELSSEPAASLEPDAVERIGRLSAPSLAALLELYGLRV